MVPLVGLVRVLQATVAAGHEAADWMDSPEGQAALASAYPESAGISLDKSRFAQ